MSNESVEQYFIPLSRGRRVRVDRDVLEKYGDAKWSFKPDRFGSGYAVRNGYAPDGKRRHIHLSREVMNPPPGFDVIFLNGDRLDCRRENLKVVTRQEANCRHSPRLDSSTGVKGITYDEWERTYSAGFRFDGRFHHVGTFPDFHSAKAAYDRAVSRRDTELERRRVEMLRRAEEAEEKRRADLGLGDEPRPDGPR